MKIIDLLNKIANGEEVPKKIKYNEEVWSYDERTQDYIYERTPLCTNFFLQELVGGCEATKELLSYEVEIIEEEKEIEEIPIPEIESVENERILRAEFKINELVREVNKLKNK